MELLAVSSVFDLSPNCFESFGTNSFIGNKEPGNFSVTISFAYHCEIHRADAIGGARGSTAPLIFLKISGKLAFSTPNISLVFPN